MVVFGVDVLKSRRRSGFTVISGPFSVPLLPATGLRAYSRLFRSFSFRRGALQHRVERIFPEWDSALGASLRTLSNVVSAHWAQACRVSCSPLAYLARDEVPDVAEEGEHWPRGSERR
jgi:hypothetical protein